MVDRADDPYASVFAPPQPPISSANEDPYAVLGLKLPAPAAADPYSASNTVGRMATDALFGIPDTINMAARGLNYGIDYGLEKLGLPPPIKTRGLKELVTGEPPKQPDYGSIPYIAPLARKAVGVAELPPEPGMAGGWLPSGRAMAEGVGSALMGGVGSAVGRGIVRGVRAAPEVIGSILNPSRPIRSVTEDALAASGERGYNALDNLDVRYHADTGPKMADAINRGAFKPEGVTTSNAPETINKVNQLRTIEPDVNVPYGTTKQGVDSTGVASGRAAQIHDPNAATGYGSTGYIIPRDIEDVRQAINKVRADAARTPGSGYREKAAANIAIEGIDNFFHNPPAAAIHPTSLNDPSLVGPVLSNARADTAAAHRLGFLEGTRDEIGTKIAAKATGSASVEAQALRDRAASALAASREGGGPLYGFNDYEKQLLEKAGTASWLARYGANAPKSLGGTILHAGSAGFGSSMLGMPHWLSATIAAGLPATEYAAKKAADWGTRRAYQNAADAIAARSPLAESLGIPAPPTARLPVGSAVSRNDIAAALAAQSELRQENQ